MGLKVVDLVKSIVASVVSEGDTVVDATVGNGNDTLFLARLVGEKGRVYGFDIQQGAINNTGELLKALGLQNRVKLIRDGHENMDEHVTGDVKAVIFNLGYLPGGNREITTLPHTTITAVKKSLQLLQPGGIIAIAAYRGHQSGKKEEALLGEYLSGLDASTFLSVSLQAVNQGNNPPVLWAVQKKEVLVQRITTEYYNSNQL
ncbi:MAG TPA: class I SAM-dependent methyltransferase [Clostridia bacterium]|nr:class I SAM-dependent methyltransferase [Clostridia bacterium]